MIGNTTGSHEHCFCLQDTIGRPLCCRCMGVLLSNGSVQMLESVKLEIMRGLESIKAGKVKPLSQVEKELGL